ncbi:MAG: energy transducer TonB [bacterium]
MSALDTKQSKSERAAQVRKKNLRERFPFLLFLSCLIHATLIILLAILFTKRMAEKAALPPEPPMPEVTLEIPPPERPFVDAKEVTDKPPEKAPFQSDENSKAASELPSTGTAPLPTQQGVSQSALELQNQRYTPGEQSSSSSGNPEPPPTPQTPPVTHPTPQPTPELTPPPPNSVKLLDLPKENSSPQPQPSATPVTPTPPQPQKSAPPVPPTPPSIPGNPGTKKGYQPETRQTVISGSISNRGRSSVAAEATPLGRYKKKVTDAIGSRWYYYVNERMGLLSIGTVNVSFKVTSSGKVSGLHVVSSNSNESLTDCSLRSIMDAKLPPIPPDVAATLQNGSLEIDYSFTIY